MIIRISVWFALFAAGASGLWGQDAVTVADDFNSFALSKALVAIEDRSAQELWALEGPRERVRCGDGVLTLEGRAGTELRLFSKAQFQYGTLTARIKFHQLGPGFNVYVGFAARDPWARSVAWMMHNDTDNGVLLSSADQVFPERLDAVRTGALATSVWHDLKLEWTPERVSLWIDGAACGSITDRRAIPGMALPMVIAIYSQTADYALSIDRIALQGVIAPEAATPRFEPTPRPLPPPEQTGGGWPDIAPSIQVTDTGAVLENRYFRYRFDWSNGLQLTELFHHRLGRNILRAPGDFFAVHRENNRIANAEFRVTRAEVQGDDLTLTLSDAGSGLVLELALGVKDDPELNIRLAIRNGSGNEVKAGISCPLLTHLQLGADPAGDGFFYPTESGAAGTLDCEFAHTYGYNAIMPVMAVYDADATGSIYGFPLDDTGTAKVLKLKKKSTPERLKNRYDVVPWGYDSQGQNPNDLFDESIGTSLAWRHLEFRLAPNAEAALPPMVIGIGAGDWHAGLRRYAEFARGWFRQQSPTPEWYQRCFGYLSAHPYSGLHLLSPLQSEGYYDRQNGCFSYARQMGPLERGTLMEFAFWWDYDPATDGKTFEALFDEGTPVINAFQTGNYQYNRTRGGLAALREEIAAVHRRGGRLSLYTFPEASAKGTELAERFGAQWAAMGSPERYRSDYTADGMGWNFCVYEQEFADTVSQILARIVRETDADGVRLDVMANLKPCFNPAHRHYRGDIRSTVPADAAGNVLGTFTRTIHAAKPDAIVTTEHGGSDYLIQFSDGYFAENIIWLSDRLPWEPYRALNMYQLVFTRFYFPEVKTWIHGPCDTREAIRMALFNAVGYACTSPEGAPVVHTLAENADAFHCADPLPEPCIPTLQTHVYANRFTGKDKTVWSVYNRTGNTLSTAALEIPRRTGVHYVDVYRDVEVAALPAGELVHLSTPIADGEVAVIAELPCRLQASRAGDGWTVAADAPAEPGWTVEILSGDDRGIPGTRVPVAGSVISVPAAGAAEQRIIKLLHDDILVDEIIVPAANPGKKQDR